MKKFLRLIKARVIYAIFGLALIMFACVMLKRDDEFRFRNGEVMSREQRIVSRFAAFVVTTVCGYISYKTAKADWVLWRRKHREPAPDGK
jgi:hypothetical protein